MSFLDRWTARPIDVPTDRPTDRPRVFGTLTICFEVRFFFRVEMLSLGGKHKGEGGGRAWGVSACKRLVFVVGPAWVCRTLCCRTVPLPYLLLGLALPCLALPCLALSCLALSCLACPCLALRCLTLACLACGKNETMDFGVMGEQSS